MLIVLMLAKYAKIDPVPPQKCRSKKLLESHLCYE